MLFIYFCIITLVLIFLGMIMPSTLHEKNIQNLHTDTENRLRHIDFALSNFISEVKQDISELLLHEIVTDPNDSGFTSFVNASEDTFEYHIGEREAAIIRDLNAFRLTHPAVNSVYMGRETGTFVRSHPRARPTRYDPRERPWYILAKEHPDQIMMTDPYPSVTTSDVNIGIVKAMTYPNGTVYGVLGADITLVNLTNYIATFDVGRSGEIILLNETGTILASKNESALFTNIKDHIGEEPTNYLLNTTSGLISLPDAYVIYYTSPMLGWKLLITIPYYEMEKAMYESVVSMLFFVFLALILLSITTLIILDKTIIRPLSYLTDITRTITMTGNLEQKITVQAKGEVQDLAQSFERMIETIKKEEDEKKNAFEELSSYRDHLEELVKERTQQLEKINQDLIRERNRAEEADQLKSAFLATMSHELRTPLNSIIGFTGIILQGLAGPLTAEQTKQLGMVQQSAKHLLALINDVLDISKIEAGELKISQEPVEIQNVIELVCATLTKSAEDKGLKLETEIAPCIGTVIGDKRRIEQILINLINNAIKFTENGHVRVKSWISDNNVYISISDTGIGIDADAMKKLFKPFQQVDTGTTRKHEGTGLGLSICKKLVELHGGIITVRSEPGKGSEFTIMFPKGDIHV